MTQPADELLAEPIRRSLWRIGWESLRPLQEDAIRMILGTRADVILSARTAAGKTEAAFLPILSQICEAPRGSIRALYVGPLKALINDQFQRLEELCEDAEIPVHRWHGDVPSDKKRQLVERPAGVLLITPESLESLLVNKSQVLPRIFHSLSFVVIDELHALLGNERGTQLRSQLFRLERYSVERSRLVALSATLGDLQGAAKWMRPDQSTSVEILKDTSAEKAIRYRIHTYQSVPAPERKKHSDEPAETDLPDQFFRDVYEHFHGSKNLIFANSKAMVEQLTDQLNELGRHNATGEEFLIHHGSLARDVREDTEQLMQGNRPFTTVCSSTLELGIDIGSVRTVGQIDSPRSVSSLTQRLGRSGRGDGEAHQMRVFIIEDRPNLQTDLDDRLYPALLQAVAITELMLEPWVESPHTQPFDLSTLVQQTLSMIAEMGGAPASVLFDRLVKRGAFRFLDQLQFAGFLRVLAQQDLIEQQPEGPLILGLIGEQIVRHYDFYAAFVAPPEYRVLHGSRLIGRLSAMAVPSPGDHLLLAARRWQVLEVNAAAEEIAVQPASGRKPPYFPAGDGDLDSRIRQKMFEVICSNAVPTYLDSVGAKLLAESRQIADEAGLKHRELVASGLNRSMWFPWAGSRVMRTLLLMFHSTDISVTPKRSGLAFTFGTALCDVLPAIQRLKDHPVSPEQLIDQDWTYEHRKWDRYVSRDLLMLAFTQDDLDIEHAVECLDRLIASTQTRTE